jgi:hypothetical protein
VLLSSRVKRGICFFANRKKKADSSGNPALGMTDLGFFRNLFSLSSFHFYRLRKSKPDMLKPVLLETERPCLQKSKWKKQMPPISACA